MLPRRKDHETELTLTRHGYAYHTGLSDLNGAWNTAAVFKTARGPRSGEIASSHPRQKGQIGIQEMIDIQKKVN
jgi:hypothetical protein